MANLVSIIEGKTAGSVAHKAMCTGWNDKTVAQIKATVHLECASNKTWVYKADWMEADEFSEARFITAYVQVYDKALDLFKVYVSH